MVQNWLLCLQNLNPDTFETSLLAIGRNVESSVFIKILLLTTGLSVLQKSKIIRFFFFFGNNQTFYWYFLYTEVKNTLHCRTNSL